MNITKYRTIFIASFPFFAGIPALLWQLLFFYVPLLFIIYLSFIASDYSSFTIGNYVLIGRENMYVTIIARSFVFAVCNACACAVVAYPLAYFLVLRARALKTFLLFLAIVPFWTNFLLHIYAWFFVLERNGLLNTILLRLHIITTPVHFLNSLPAVMLVMLYSYLPFMVLPLYSTLEKLDIHLLEASADLGANAWQTFFKVTLPLTISGLQTGFLLVLVPSFGEFAIPALVGGDRTMFVGSLISYLFLSGNNQPLGSAFALISSILLIIAAFSIYTLLNKLR